MKGVHRLASLAPNLSQLCTKATSNHRDEEKSGKRHPESHLPVARRHVPEKEVDVKEYRTAGPPGVQSVQIREKRHGSRVIFEFVSEIEHLVHPRRLEAVNREEFSIRQLCSCLFPRLVEILHGLLAFLSARLCPLLQRSRGRKAQVVLHFAVDTESDELAVEDSRHIDAVESAGVVEARGVLVEEALYPLCTCIKVSSPMDLYSHVQAPFRKVHSLSERLQTMP
mmetsp:Transcript_1099/g.2290  ORF Transcript_1099/g.2290 Transcript_1099/m.2290 type:complete len:225 (+) Transcript_1099:1443-2117(+)